MKTLLFAFFLTSVPHVVRANCDKAVGDGLCPDAFTLEETATCLIANREKVDDTCKAFIDMNVKCGSELARCGGGIAWGGDATLCVTQWTRKEDLSPECASTLPEPVVEEEKEEEVDDATAARRAKRKRARAKAAEEVRNLNEKNSKKGKGAKKPKPSKRSRRKAKAIDDDDL